MSARQRLAQRENSLRLLLGVLEEQQSCFVPRLESQAGGIFLKVEDLTSLLSGTGSEEELCFQEEFWLDLSGSASGGRGC